MLRSATTMIAAFVLGTSGVSTCFADWNDPTRPDNLRVAVARTAAPVYSVSAIFTSNDRQVAVLNGRLVREGDRIGRAEVVRIDKDRVTLSVDERTLVAVLSNRRNAR